MTAQLFLILILSVISLGSTLDLEYISPKFGYFNLNNAAIGNDAFVLLTSSQTPSILYSSDAQTWSSTPVTLSTMCYYPGMSAFIGLSYSVTLGQLDINIMKSTNGSSWTTFQTIQTTTSTTVPTLTCGRHSAIIAITQAYQIWISKGSNNFTTAPYTLPANLLSLQWVDTNNTFVATGGGFQIPCVISFSLDGSNFWPTPLTTQGSFCSSGSIVQGNGVTLMAGPYGIFSTINGASWLRTFAFTGQCTLIYQSSQKRFVLFLNLLSVIEIFTSPDGQTWTNLNIGMNGFDSNAPFVLQGPKVTLLAFDGGYIGLSPSDAIAFHSISHITLDNLQWIVPGYDGGFFVAGQRSGWSSPTGKTWTPVTYQSGSKISSSPSGISTKFHLYAAQVYNPNNQEVTGVIVSKDGSQWEQTLNIFNSPYPPFTMNTLASNGTGIFIYAKDNQGDNYIVYSQGNSGNWVTVGTQSLMSLISIQNTLISFTVSQSQAAMIVSRDGVNWATVDVNVDPYFVYYGTQATNNSKIVVVYAQSASPSVLVGNVKNLTEPWRVSKLPPVPTSFRLFFSLRDVIYGLTWGSGTQQWWTSTSDGVAWSTPKSILGAGPYPSIAVVNDVAVIIGGSGFIVRITP